MALPPGLTPLQRGGEPQLRQGARGGRRRVPARHAGAARRLPPPEDGGAPPPRPPGAGRRVRRRHRPLPQPQRRRRPPRRPAVPAHGGRLRAAPALARRPARPARPGRGRHRGRLPRTVGGPGAAQPQSRHPAARARAPGGRQRGPSAAAVTRPGTPRHAHRAGTADLSEPSAARLPLRPRRGTQHRPGVPQGAAQGPGPDLPGGPVPVVPPGRGLLRPGAAQPSATVHDRCRPLRTGTGRPAHPAHEPDRADHRPGRAAPRRRRPGRRVQPGEPRRDPGLRARQGVRDRRRLGLRGLRQRQPPFVDPRFRTQLRRLRRDPGPAAAPRPGRTRRRRPRLRPEPAPGAHARAPGRRGRGGRPTADALCDPATAYGAFEEAAAALDGWYAGGCRGPRPAGRLRRYVAPDLSAARRLLATPLHHVLVDPDGRPFGMRRRNAF